MCLWAYLRGTIETGDYEKLRLLYRNNQRMLTVLALVSPGGNVDQAIMIGKLLRRYLITARAPERLISPAIPGGESRLSPGGMHMTLCEGSECVCASACALIWFGAVERQGLVGLHRPRIDDPAFKALPPDEAAKVYRRVLDDIARYLDAMEAPRPMIDAMVATGSSEIRWVDAQADHLERPASYAEWEDAACGEFTAEQFDSMIDLRVKRDATQLSSNDALLLTLLEEKHSAVWKCTRTLRFSRVDQLPPP
jgi:hypothetical protein